MKKYFKATKNISFSYRESYQGFNGLLYKTRLFEADKGDILTQDVVNWILSPSLFPRNVSEKDFSQINPPFGWGILRKVDYTKKNILYAQYMPTIPIIGESPNGNFTKMWTTKEISELINSGDYPDWFILRNYKDTVSEWMEKWTIQLEWEKEEEKRNKAAREAFLAKSNRN